MRIETATYGPVRSTLWTALLLAASLSPSLAQAPSSVATRLATQNALFEEFFQAEMKESPETATAYGDYRYNDRLDDYSLAAVERIHAANVGYLARIDAIPTAGFGEQDQLSHDLFHRMLDQRLADWSFKEYEMPVSQFNSPHLSLADLPLSMPFDSVKHYEDYIARLHQIPRVFTQTEEVLRAGMKDGLVQVRYLLEKVPVQCQGIVSEDPFLIPLKKFPATFSDADKARLTKQITDAVNADVLPAYKQFAGFIATEYAPHGRTALAVTSLPDGQRRYQNDIHRLTTTSLSPEVIHNLGLAEIDRIEAEMTVIAKSQGFADLAGFRASVKTNPRFIPTSADQILEDFRRYIAQMQPKLPELFTFIPGSPVTVEAIPAFQSAAATHYQTGTPDGKRPGRVVVATSDFAHRSMVNDEAVAYHEGIPGHHMQLSVQQQLKGLPTFRLHTFNSGYIEGWALYAEQLGKEVGFYRDPISDFGRLNSELFRAVRLVVDTGIHSQGWSRDQVVEFFRKYGVADEPMIQSETDRYIAWPGQALSYKLGQLKFRELRDRAKKELGAKFDIRTFHDEMLSGGVLPLDMLDARTDAWIAAQKAGTAAAGKAPPDPDGPVKVSGGVAAGMIVRRQPPVYPNDAREQHVSGTVILHAIISKTGDIKNLTVVSGPELLRPAALDAVQQWKYKPYLLMGKPTEVSTTITVNFTFGGR
jgi:TonB family protein